MDESRVHLKLDGSACASVDAYLEYKRIVGEDDGGKLFTPKEYEEYKEKVIPQRAKNRLFTSWTASSGMDCKLIGPETLCFCQHRYKQHKTDFEVVPDGRPIKLPCRAPGCKCKTYHYVPLNGSQPIRCHCKHFADDHSEGAPYKCRKSCGCKKFYSSFTCGCGEPTYAHRMIVETKEERVARGHPVGQDVPYAAMGGLTGFSSLMDAYMRLDDSGIGAPPAHALERPVGVEDHPFLRAHAGMSHLSIEDRPGGGNTDRRVATRTTEEEDMAYFEKQYQQRLKAERERARQDRLGPRGTAGSLPAASSARKPVNKKPSRPAHQMK